MRLRWFIMINLLPKIFPRSDEARQADFLRSLLQNEAVIGGQLFGPIPKGHKRQFFCLDENTWIWYEEWTVKGQKLNVTTRYDVRPNGIIKTQDGQTPQVLTDNETINLYKATELYYKKISANYEQMLAA
jgi:hypothetical protein